MKQDVTEIQELVYICPTKVRKKSAGKCDINLLTWKTSVRVLFYHVVLSFHFLLFDARYRVAITDINEEEFRVKTLIFLDNAVKSSFAKLSEEKKG